MARSSSSGAFVAGISVPGTPRRIVSNTRASVAPFANSTVRSGPCTPLASTPWQSEHRN